MNDVMLRRLIGIAVLLLTALALSFFLPRPGLVEPQADGTRLVTVDLSDPDSEAVEVPEPGVLEATESPAFAAEPETGASESESVSALEVESPGDVKPAPNEAPIASPPASAPDRPAETDPIVNKPAVKATTPPEPTPKPQTKPLEPAPAKPAKPPVPATPPPAAAGGNTWYVQVGAYGKLENAEDVRAQVKALGVSSVISPADTAGGPLYRVRAGPYPRAQADTIRERLVRGKLPANVVAR